MTRAPGWDPVPAAARVQLERLGARWRTLPLPQALGHAPALRALAREFAAECATAEGGSSAADSGTAGAPDIADLGPATAYDQLVTLTFELARVCAANSKGDDRERLAGLADRLACLRRAIG